MTLATGHAIVDLTPRQQELQKLFNGPNTKFHTLQPGGWFFPEGQKKACQDVKNFEFEEGEVVVMTVPKSGTTWTQEAVWTMKKNPNLESPLTEDPLNLRSPIIGCTASILTEGLAETREEARPQEGGAAPSNPLLDIARNAERPRVLKTHLSFPFLSETVLTKAKVVYTIRDPRDVCISYHHHSRLFKYLSFAGTFDQYIDAFLENAVVYGPYWSHVGAAWERRSSPNLLILFYEKMKKDPMAEFSKLGKFLGLDLSADQIEKIIKHTSFSEMQQRDDHVLSKSGQSVFLNLDFAATEGGFFRSGTSGKWKEVLTRQQNEKFEAWIERNCPDKEIMNCILNP